jgi:hypothetical protein
MTLVHALERLKAAVEAAPDDAVLDIYARLRPWRSQTSKIVLRQGRSSIIGTVQHHLFGPSSLVLQAEGVARDLRGLLAGLEKLTK